MGDRPVWAASAAFAAACGAPTAHVERPCQTAWSATFLHAGFGAGPLLFTDADGTLLEERRHDPFGAPIDAASSAHDLGALNQQIDAASGWSDHGARWLAPEVGRWLAADRWAGAPDTTAMTAPWGLHPYQYANQDPVSSWDRDGRGPVRATGFEQRRPRDLRVLEHAFSLAGRSSWSPAAADAAGLPVWRQILSPDWSATQAAWTLVGYFQHRAADGEPVLGFELATKVPMESFEFVLFAGYRAGYVTEDWIRSLGTMPLDPKPAASAWRPGKRMVPGDLVLRPIDERPEILTLPRSGPSAARATYRVDEPGMPRRDDAPRGT